ncbi:hypothetical protein COEREDRAFT_99273 [Coemansia reversa NRRL 1564]|uniref:Uncharacterized protein n=1 Tax=Coemansia reversa (strain ATCC 12441 / NRRL 1564) TaxID=763665 RepID=A0A2G5B4C6_COERN|nr:hypothetical protein COEREDRAFT_99273 [Coemansia reversa NRRL 1564]|eukprot:PIA13855.1 hypothetical protein COEREDRAFT_99273 [Coemansia reversa NRRL 1564]
MLEDVAHSSSLCHVKNIYLSIDILELLDLSNNDLRLMSTLHNYGKLTGVRSTEIFFEHDSDKSTTSFNQKSNSILTAATIKMLKKIEIFAITLHNFMPNVKRISVDKAFFDGRIGDGQLHIGVIISLIFNQICPEYGPISSISMTIDRFSTAGPGDIALQKIILFNARLEQDAEIIRRNSNTLEVLTICGEHYTDAISEILGYDGVSFHITYSQLKHLQLDVSVPAHSQPPPEPRKPLALDPFPRLVTLIYHGVFPLHSLLAMNEISPHIRHLEVIMDSKLVWLSSQNQVLGSRSLANIDYLSLTWSLEAFNNHFSAAVLKFKRSPRKAAEFTVLLTDVIGSITRVCIIPESEFAKKVSANIVFALFNLSCLAGGSKKRANITAMLGFAALLDVTVLVYCTTTRDLFTYYM